MAGIVRKLGDGFSTTITLTGAGVTFWEKTVQPPGLDGGEPVDTTTMRNTSVRTKAPRRLYEGSAMTVKASYDPTVYNSIKAAINANQEIVTTFPDGGTLTFWGYLQKFAPDALEEGKQPEATITVVPTFTNASGVEIAPVVVEGSGTG
jgi:hypothetical protein